MKALLCRMAPAEEGIGLATDVYLPPGPGPFPTVLVRTPYHRSGHANTARPFVERGYAYTVQDCRGKFDSQGTFTPLVDEARDGQAALDWVAEQPWCNGRIGMWGRSYLGIVQVPAASGGHEALRCIAPSVAPGSYFRDWIRHDGCFALGNAVRWSLTNGSCTTRPGLDHFAWEELHGLAGPAAIAERVGFSTPALGDWASHDAYDGYWSAVDQDHMHPHVAIPGLHAGGWFDHLTRSQYEAYRQISDGGATELARSGQRLLIGPWGHQTIGGSGPAHQTYGQWDFGAEADFPVLAHELQFLDYHLKELDNGYSSQAPVKVFLMGENRWLGLGDWPPPGSQVQEWYLTSGGSANMRSGDGRLQTTAPTAAADDSYTYDPRDPVPTCGGAVYWGLEPRGPVDQRPILNRPDVLYYRSEKLGQGLCVVGDIGLDLYVSSDAEDTDLVAKLCVEDASGAITCLTQGSLRCRYRSGWEEAQPLVPGAATHLRLQLGQTGYTFAPGSRVGLTITSSDFPGILPHPNRLGAPWEAAGGVPAKTHILHGPATVSCLRLPVLQP
ncbi:CocE/NonD family hydrolase [Candidatus Latescibacterota bacterium]